MTVAQLIKELREHQVVLRLENEKLLCELPRQGIPNTLKSELVARKEEVKTYIANTIAGKREQVTIPRRPAVQHANVLSFAQQSLWMLDQFNGGSAHYNMPNAIKLSGILNTAAFNKAFTTIFERHESLRTCFGVDENGLPVAVLLPIPVFSAEACDVSALATPLQQSKIIELVDAEAAKPFDLTKDLMLRALLIKVSETEHVLSVTMHHIASDGWSVTILIKEFAALYSAYLKDEASPLPPIEVQYADYAYWQRHGIKKEEFEQHIHYWEKQLEDLPVVHSVPLDFARPAVQTTSGDVFSSHIDAITTRSLNNLCHAHGATLYMGLHAAFATFLSRYSNEMDIVIGTATANREQPEITGLIGYFINILILRSQLSHSAHFIDVLQQSKTMLLDAYTHQQAPYSELIERLVPQGSLSYSPLCQIMLILQNTEEVTLELPDVTLSTIPQSNMTAKHDLTLYVTEGVEGLSLSWEYNTDLFKVSTIQQMANHFDLLLKSLLANPAENIFNLSMISDAERQQLLVGWNNTAKAYPAQVCVHQLIEQWASETPEAVALTFQSKSYTYKELNTKANQLAHYLVAHKNVKPDTLVGILLERSLDMIVAILGILKAGGAYVPLDPDYPKARLAYMLADANLATVITQSHLLDSSPVKHDQALCIDDAELQATLEQQSSINILPGDIALGANHLAYVIYTSGSTGNPKGVMIRHNGLVNLAAALAERYHMKNTDTVLQFAPISFDMSVEEIFGALCSGSRLVVRTDDWLDSVDAFYTHCESFGITVLNLPTAFWHELARDNTAFRAQAVRHISVGGEKVSHVEIQNWYSKSGHLPRLLNAYGPTECTVNASFAEIMQGYKNNIGTPLANMSLYVLNSHLQMAPIGVGGELHIGGVGLAKGYLNRPDLTAEKFISNPHHNHAHSGSSEYIYKTGDLVRWLPNGDLEYLGRIDHQIKVRGFRIELGEIESALAEHAQVKDVVVLAKESTTGDNRLIAYLVVSANIIAENKSNPALFIEQLRQYLGQSLPDYMIPSAFILLEKLPLTPNGKVDRKAFPEPDFSGTRVGYVAPQTEVEKIICSIWQDVLGLDVISVKDNFFSLGGNSLSAIRALSKVNSNCDIKLSIRSLFLDPTVAGVARVIETMKLNEQNLNHLFDNELVEEGFF